MSEMGMIWTGMREFRDRLDEMIEKADAAARQAVTEAGHLIERRAKENAPVQSGTLRRSIHVDSITKLGPGKWESRTGPSVIYARIRERGGTIRPRNAPALSWVSKSGFTSRSGTQYPAGTRVFLQPGQSVTQQGTHYMQRAFDESISGIREIYRLAFEEAWK